VRVTVETALGSVIALSPADFTIVRDAATVAGGGGGAGSPNAGRVLRLAPNPARRAVTVWTDLAAGTLGRLAIYDVAGRLVRQVPVDGGSSGSSTLVVLLVQRTGETMPAGVYFARLRAAGGTRVVKFLVVR
jgi:hypothetical protein